HVAMGKQVGILDLTRGELGTRGTAELRAKEAAEGAKIMGVSIRENAGLRDGFFTIDEANFLPIIYFLRLYQPEIVLCNAIKDRHPDHGRAAQLVSEACFLSGLRKVETQHNGSTQEAWRPKAIYHYIQDNWVDPHFVVDITEVMDVKMKAIQAFSSQFFNADTATDEPVTPISTPEFLAFIDARARQFGRIISATYGEGFTVERAAGVSDITLLR
ncbi:MAG TPA: bacillithiol biosynthesis deacetylase BshB1, partial [Bacteroidia bacterium]|nr:bacillithiol biosynthesis deacetylase BshB1 [Bacteroidia bacterium]